MDKKLEELKKQKEEFEKFVAWYLPVAIILSFIAIYFRPELIKFFTY